MLKKILLALMILSLCACHHRISVLQLNDDTYKISVRGNGFASHDKVQTALLRKCAQLTQANGYKYFIITSGNTDTENSEFATPTTVATQTTGYANGELTGATYGRTFSGEYNGYGIAQSTSSINPGMIVHVKKYTDTAIIKMLNKNVSGAFNADLILANFKHRRNYTARGHNLSIITS